MQQPTVGRIVLYYQAGSVTPVPAIIVEVNGDWDADDPDSVTLNLTVFKQADHAAAAWGVRWADAAEGVYNTWHWPPRV